MVSKPQLQSPTVVVGNCSKGSPSFRELATKYDAGYLKSKRAKDVLTGSVAVTTTRTNDDKNKTLRVSFSEYADVFEVPYPTKKEKKSMYMNKEDQKLILREVVTAMRRFHDLDESSIEDLGLEWIVENQGVERKKRMKSAIDVVLQRQRQFRILNPSKSKILNDLWLDKHYRPFSKVSASLARSRGLRDQEKSPYFFPRRNAMSRESSLVSIELTQ